MKYINTILIITAITTAGYSGYLLGSKLDSSSKIPKIEETTQQFIKDAVTKCQYILTCKGASCAMYPRLDDRRNHICNEDKKYHFNPES